MLTPDFLGDDSAIDAVTDANPEVFNHNLETVPRLHRIVRGRALYARSLGLLDRVSRRAPHMITKAGLMLGIGETIDELFEVFADLRSIKCDVLTLGQYLAPTAKHIPVQRFVPPEEFDSIAAARAVTRLQASGSRAVRAVELSRCRDGGNGVKEPTRVLLTVPELGSDRIAFSLWHVRAGDRVTEGDRVAEVLTPGARSSTFRLAGGTLRRTNRPTRRCTLRPGAVIGEIQAGVRFHSKDTTFAQSTQRRQKRVGEIEIKNYECLHLAAALCFLCALCGGNREPNMPRSAFVSLDGLDGTGKSTQSRLLVEWLNTQKVPVTACTDPGGTASGQELRKILLFGREHRIGTITEAMLFMASRAQLVEEVIRPALERGEVVVSDRFLLANVVYQGHAGGLKPEDLWAVGRFVTGGLEPDLTLVFDLPPEVAAARRIAKRTGWNLAVKIS